jgi:putative ABC transport system permease protein
MKINFFSKMALSNLCKNQRLYIPHILTGAGLTAVFYILITLSMDRMIHEMRGGSYIEICMQFGVFVMGMLSVILILYTNSFLMKQRKQELGLYNILGMEKRHVGRVLFFETFYSSILTIVLGLVTGVLLYKICTLFICYLLKVESVWGFYHITPTTLVPTALFFAGLYLITYLFNRIRITVMKPVELLQSAHVGEREPKVKWLFLLVGLLTLGGGYYIAVTTKNPLSAVSLFLAAVLLVIIGTYCLFVTGSIAFLKLLKKNEKYYYQKRHMIAVSGMLYRMKQNAVGLASITILASAVLVMASTTVSLYVGIQDAVHNACPHHIQVTSSYRDSDGEKQSIPMEELKEIAEEIAKQNGLEIAYMDKQHMIDIVYLYENGEFMINDLYLSQVQVPENIVQCFYLTEEEYNSHAKEPIALEKNQVAYYGNPDRTLELDHQFTLADQQFEAAIELDEFPVSVASVITNTYGIVVKDGEVLQKIYQDQIQKKSAFASEIEEYFYIDFADVDDILQTDGIRLGDEVQAAMREYVIQLTDGKGEMGMVFDSVWEEESYFLGMYGSLFFLGLILTIVFLFATALIIYYKQISEGYEDRKRFQIMQKVGMSAGEVKSAIRSQILMVFFLPIIVAAIHIAFAFPILSRLLHILFFSGNLLFLGCMVGSLLLFCLIYIVIYRVTAGVYYKIVH